MSQIKSGAKVLLTLSMIAALAACGGGGSAPDTTTSPSNNTGGGSVAFVDSVAANTTVVPGSYADADRVLAFDRLNAIRLSAGLGVLRQVAELDTAAQGHDDYLSLNDATGHYQTLGNNGFTGETPQDRGVAASYSASTTITEVQATSTTVYPGDWHIDTLMSAPYHRLAMLYYRMDEVGVGYNANWPSNLVVDMARKPGQGAPSTLAVVWPVADAIDIATTGAPEVPNPIAENNGSPHGYPVSVSTHENKVLAVTSFTLTDSVGSTVATKLLTYATDSNLQTYQARHFASLVPRAPLSSGITYTANFVGTIDGVAYTKTWSFTTY